MRKSSNKNSSKGSRGKNKSRKNSSSRAKSAKKKVEAKSMQEKGASRSMSGVRAGRQDQPTMGRASESEARNQSGDLDEHSRDELIEMARDLDVKNRSRMKKSDLMRAIRQGR